jgi:hypothetical protein
VLWVLLSGAKGAVGRWSGDARSRLRSPPHAAHLEAVLRAVRRLGQVELHALGALQLGGLAAPVFCCGSSSSGGWCRASGVVGGIGVGDGAASRRCSFSATGAGGAPPNGRVPRPFAPAVDLPARAHLKQAPSTMAALPSLSLLLLRPPRSQRARRSREVSRACEGVGNRCGWVGRLQKGWLCVGRAVRAMEEEERRATARRPRRRRRRHALRCVRSSSADRPSRFDDRTHKHTAYTQSTT